MPPPSAIAHYRVVSKLGEGGMGAVYRATDTRLNRDVAIKVLPPAFAEHAGRMQRFEREAKVLASLNHPNIVTVHDIGQADGTTFIVMECVEGKTLSQLIGRKGLELDDALALAIQVAGALANAHAAGIVHRDLKPANLMTTREGLVKVLDFGLAKLSEQLAPDDVTVTTPTAEGTIVGTVAYMSPEQAEGRIVDARSDIFSFGAVLYEMLSGRRAFDAGSAVSTLAAILHSEPAPLRDIIGPVPPQLESILALCLRKDPVRRFQHMDDVKVALQQVLEANGEALIQTSRPTGRSPRIRTVVPGMLSLVAVAVGLIWWFLRPPPGPMVILRRLTADSGLATDPALSPDGRMIAYSSDRAESGNLDIWIRQVAGGDAVRLTRDVADEHQATFSPDGTTIAFRSEREGGGIYLISALGGEPRLFARQAYWPRFSPDGNWIAYTAGSSFWRTLFVASASGGMHRVLPGIVSSGRPIWSPDGNYILLAGTDLKGALAARSDWWMVPVNPGIPPVKTGVENYLNQRSLNRSTPVDWAEDRILFSAAFGDSMNIWELRLSAPSFRISRSPRRLTMGTEPELRARFGNGQRIVFSTESSRVSLWTARIDAATGRALGDLRPLTSDAASDGLPSLSADGTVLAFLSTRSGNPDVWLMKLDSDRPVRLTTTLSEEYLPVIARDGSRVFYQATEGKKQLLYRIDVSNGIPERICENCGGPTDCSSDGKYLLVQYRLNAPQSTLGVMDLRSGVVSEVLKHSQYGLYRGHFSPDDRWVVFHADAPGRGTRVCIAPFRGSAAIGERDWIELTHGETWDDAPRWSPKGDLVYYVSERDGFRCIWGQRLAPASKKPDGEPIALQHLHNQRRSALNVDVNHLDLAVASDKIVFPLGELTGNIWMADFH